MPPTSLKPVRSRLMIAPTKVIRAASPSKEERVSCARPRMCRRSALHEMMMCMRRGRTSSRWK